MFAGHGGVLCAARRKQLSADNVWWGGWHVWRMSAWHHFFFGWLFLLIHTALYIVLV